MRDIQRAIQYSLIGAASLKFLVPTRAKRTAEGLERDRASGRGSKYKVQGHNPRGSRARYPGSDRRPRRASGRNGVMEYGVRVSAFGDSIARRRPSLEYCNNTASAPPPLQNPILLPTYREQARCLTPPTAHAHAHRLIPGWPPRPKPDQTRPDPAHHGGGKQS